MIRYMIDIQDELGVPDFPNDLLRSAIGYVLERHDVPAGSGISVVISDDEQVRALNAQHRGVDAVTDILSFPADPLPPELLEQIAAQIDHDPEDEAPYLGDLIIAFDYTLHQAEEAGHRLEDELVLLVIHGTLHLLGYDHDNEANQDAMWAEQHNALAALGVEIDVPRFTFDDGDE